MSEPTTIVSVEMAEDARAKAFEALLDAAEAYPERGTSVQVMQAALAYADAASCVEWARDISRRIRRDIELCERFQSPGGPALEALARAPVDTEPLPPELEGVLDQRIADVRAGMQMVPHADVLTKLTVPNEDEEGGTT